MTDTDPKRAEALRRKYGMDNPPEANNPVVGRILAGEQLHGRVFTRDSAELFDPIRSPRMHEKLMAALHDLHTGIAAGTITRDCHDSDRPGRPFDPDEPELLVHLVGSAMATVIRGQKRLRAFERATRNRRPQRRGVDYFAGMYRLMAELNDDFWDISCNVNVARKCGGAPQLMPYLAGSVMLIFSVCDPCLMYAEAAATTGYELSVMEAHARVGLPFP